MQKGAGRPLFVELTYDEVHMSNRQRNTGFTLIELMIVVVIIAILAAISILAYSDYVAKTQAASAFSEVAAGKTAFEIRVNSDDPILTASDIGMLAEGSRCTNVTVAFDAADGTGSISCTVVGNSSVGGRPMNLTRDSEGGWTCTTTIAEKYRPKGCDEE